MRTLASGERTLCQQISLYIIEHCSRIVRGGVYGELPDELASGKACGKQELEKGVAWRLYVAVRGNCGVLYRKRVTSQNEG